MFCGARASVQACALPSAYMRWGCLCHSPCHVFSISNKCFFFWGRENHIKISWFLVCNCPIVVKMSWWWLICGAETTRIRTDRYTRNRTKLASSIWNLEIFTFSQNRFDTRGSCKALETMLSSGHAVADMYKARACVQAHSLPAGASKTSWIWTRPKKCKGWHHHPCPKNARQGVLPVGRTDADALAASRDAASVMMTLRSMMQGLVLMEGLKRVGDLQQIPCFCTWFSFSRVSTRISWQTHSISLPCCIRLRPALRPFHKRCLNLAVKQRDELAKGGIQEVWFPDVHTCCFK
jgi:hypothetical protein